MTFIHPYYVSPEAKRGYDVEVGPFSNIHANLISANRIKVGAYCEFGAGLTTGHRITAGAVDLLLRQLLCRKY